MTRLKGTIIRQDIFIYKVPRMLAFALLVSVFVNCVVCQLHDESFPILPSDVETGRRLTREYRLKQGLVKGLILEPRDSRGLDGVEVFLGLPYAAPPVGGMRFMPPGSAPYWSGVKLATSFAPVCPQMLPDLKREASLSAGRYNYMKRLLPFLRNQSEDCLYLNVYVPSNEGFPTQTGVKKYPVLIFIHGESFEWNSGNPYDGTVLAAYGKIIVVTVNFRLGILGFMKPSISEHTIGNFGLLDQIAALHWVKENIAAFNGDPGSVTLAGHGTGAACVNFLMVSPVAHGLFHRAILMSGSALSEWALTSNPLQFTVQVAQSLNCPLESDDLSECLRKKRISEIMAVRVAAPKFVTPFGPIIDGSVIPNEPAQVMGVYKDLFSKYELMYGCTELESYHLLGAVALAHGMLETERDSLLRLYTQAKFEYRPDLALATTLKEYSSFDLDMGRSAADTHRDSVLDILSDARVVAPLVQTAIFHSKANPKSFFYIFGHNSQAGEYAALSKSVHGEELAYIFGVPLGARKNHFREEYSPQEKLFSEIIMTFWTNFARTGNPNTPTKNSFLSLGPKDWDKYDIDWPKYNIHNQSYIHLGIPPYISSYYRGRFMRYWNEGLPNMLKNLTKNIYVDYEKHVKTTAKPNRIFGAPPAWLNPPPIRQPSFPEENGNIYGRFNSFPKPVQNQKPPAEDPYDALRKMEKPNRPMIPGLMDGPLRKHKYNKEEQPLVFVQPTTESISRDASTENTTVLHKSSLTVNIVVGIGIAFLLVNIIAFTILYYKKNKLKSREREIKMISSYGNGDTVDGNVNLYEKTETADTKGCNVFSVLKSSKSNDDFYEPVKNNMGSPKTVKSDDSGGFGQRFKLRRHMSNSTLDANTKVRDWIAHEIAQKCSPIYSRKNEDVEDIDISKDRTLPLTISLCKEKIYETPVMPKPNCQIGILTGSLTSPNNRFEENFQNYDSLDRSVPCNTGKACGSGKSSKQSTSSKSNKSKKSHHSDSNGSLHKTKKPQKVSVAVDATPATRSGSVLKQEPIELTKSLDYCCYDQTIHGNTLPLRKSHTLDDFATQASDNSSSNENTFKSTVKLEVQPSEADNSSEVVKIVHKHSVSDPIKDINYTEMMQNQRQMQTFNAIQPPVAFRNDINVTSRDETKRKSPLSPEEALLTIKRRNYPKVLPDVPKLGDYSINSMQKRLSLPPQCHLLMLSNQSNTHNTGVIPSPPIPPPRTTSTLPRQYSGTDEVDYPHILNSTNNSPPQYVEMSSHTLPTSMRNYPHNFIPLYSEIGPKKKNRVNMMEIEASDASASERTDSEFESDAETGNSRSNSLKKHPRVIIAPNQIPEVIDPKIIIKPNINRKPRTPTSIPRVIARDNSFELQTHNNKANPPKDMGKFIKQPTNIIEIPIYKPDSKGPPTPAEMQRTQSFSESNDEKKPVQATKPETSIDKLKDEQSKISTKTDKKSSGNVVKSGSSSKIPKTPTMGLKNSKKEQTKTHSSKPKLQAKTPNKNSGIPQPSSIAQKNSEKSSIDSEKSSVSSNDTESSTGTVKKMK